LGFFNGRKKFPTIIWRRNRLKGRGSKSQWTQKRFSSLRNSVCD